MIKQRILIVDDDQAQCRSIVRTLESNGMRCSSVHDGTAALQVLRNRSHLPDALILDVHLPDVSGLGVLQILREEGLAIPTLLISGLSVSPTLDQLAHLGCNDFLEKPFEAEQLLERIRRLRPNRHAPTDTLPATILDGRKPATRQEL